MRASRLESITTLTVVLEHSCLMVFRVFGLALIKNENWITF